MALPLNAAAKLCNFYTTVCNKLVYGFAYSSGRISELPVY
jgi:hypothetical protein